MIDYYIKNYIVVLRVFFVYNICWKGVLALKRICIFLSEGFEEVEALTVVDLLRRADIEISTVAIGEEKCVEGRSGIKVIAEYTIDDINFSEYDGIVLPGGMPGTENLYACSKLCENIKEFNDSKKLLAAICAAPVILGRMVILKGKRACCYPGMENELEEAAVENKPVSVDDNIITSRGVGTAIPFSKAIVEYISGNETAENVMKSIVYFD